MTSKKQVLAVALAGVLLLSSVAAAGVVRSATANDSLTTAVENAGNDGATVTVTQNGTAVENASVTVEASNESSYAGTGDYTTDENGTVSLVEPEQDVTVEITATTENATDSTTATLSATEDDSISFGRMVSSFVHDMLNAGDSDGSIGQAISDFVTSNNPGADKKPDHAGKPDDAGKSADASAQNSSSENDTDEKGSQGPPEDAGKGNGNGHGQNSDDSSDEETTTATTEE